MITTGNENENGQEPAEIRCQLISCQSRNITQLAKDDFRFCTDCGQILCKFCQSTHDDGHTIIENADFTSLQQQMTKMIPEIGNISPILQNGQLNGSNDSKMMSEDTLPDTEEKKMTENAKPDFISKLNFLEEDSDEDDDDDDDNELKKLININAKPAALNNSMNSNIHANIQNDESGNSSSDDDDDMKSFAKSKITTIGKTPVSPSIAAIDDNFSKNSFDSKMPYMNINSTTEDQRSSNFSKPQQMMSSNANHSAQNPNSNFLQVPRDFSNVKQTIGQQPQFSSGQSVQNSAIRNSIPSYQPAANPFSNQHALTEVQKILLSKPEYEALMTQFYQDKVPPKNTVKQKTAKILGKKKRKAKDELAGFDNDDSMMVEEDYPIPEQPQKDVLQATYDQKTLNELKMRSKRMFEEIKNESDGLFKDIKPHIHGLQYQRDELDRINKYKKYAVEGIESYFLYLKDQFQIEYDKLKKCKKRDKLSKMMNRILDCQEKYQHFKEPKDFVNFVNKDYKHYFSMIKAQLQEIQKEGNDFPPAFKIVYENLYDIFFSLISYISLNLPNQKSYSQFTQPIISIQNSKCHLIPIHYPNKRVVGLYDCRTQEIEEIQYDCSLIQDFLRYSNFQLLCDQDFIYFMGGNLFLEEKNTFLPTSKCFKMSRHSGEIMSIKDMPQPKMKFGVSLMNNSIYVFGGLITAEKHRTNSCEKYDILSNQWKLLNPMQKNRVCPLVSSFVTGVNQNQVQQIYLFGGMEDKNNINDSIEIFDSKLDIWIDYIDRVANSRCYIPKQLGYAVQINQEQILLLGGFSGRKQKPCSSMQVYNVSKKSVTTLSIDSLPTGVIKDSFCGIPVVYNKSVMVLNTQVSQYFPILKQLQGVTNVLKIGLNQQEIIATHCF